MDIQFQVRENPQRLTDWKPLVGSPLTATKPYSFFLLFPLDFGLVSDLELDSEESLLDEPGLASLEALSDDSVFFGLSASADFL